MHCSICFPYQYRPFERAREDAPSILPCSQSTMIQSGFALASALDTLEPGNICYRPYQYSNIIFVLLFEVGGGRV